MRSRNGNRFTSLPICTIIIFLTFYSLALNASEYFISYQSYIENSMLHNESLEISPAMKKCLGSPSLSIILPVPVNKNKKLQTIIQANKEDFFVYLNKLGFQIKSLTHITNSHAHTFTTLTLKSTCFKVDFNDTFVKISALK